MEGKEVREYERGMMYMSECWGRGGGYVVMPFLSPEATQGTAPSAATVD